MLSAIVVFARISANLSSKKALWDLSARGRATGFDAESAPSRVCAKGSLAEALPRSWPKDNTITFNKMAQENAFGDGVGSRD